MRVPQTFEVVLAFDNGNHRSRRVDGLLDDNDPIPSFDFVRKKGCDGTTVCGVVKQVVLIVYDRWFGRGLIVHW